MLGLVAMVLDADSLSFKIRSNNGHAARGPESGVEYTNFMRPGSKMASNVKSSSVRPTLSSLIWSFHPLACTQIVGLNDRVDYWRGDKSKFFHHWIVSSVNSLCPTSPVPFWTQLEGVHVAPSLFSRFLSSRSIRYVSKLNTLMCFLLVMHTSWGKRAMLLHVLTTNWLYAFDLEGTPDGQWHQEMHSGTVWWGIDVPRIIARLFISRKSGITHSPWRRWNEMTTIWRIEPLEWRFQCL
jgi:hypothetical protein